MRLGVELVFSEMSRNRTQKKIHQQKTIFDRQLNFKFSNTSTQLSNIAHKILICLICKSNLNWIEKHFYFFVDNCLAARLDHQTHFLQLN